MLAIFAVNLHPVCQPVCNVKSQQYRSKNVTSCACHEHYS